MKLYIDFDGTLFDTDRQYMDFIEVCNSYGVTDDMIYIATQELLSKKQLFNIEKIIDYLIYKYNINNSIYGHIDKLFNASYLFDDVLDSLRTLIDLGHELYIITYGDFEFQKRKIKGSKISNYFKDIIITQLDKSKLGLDKMNSIFIDNNPKQVCQLHNAGYNVIRIRRNTDKYSSLNTNISQIIECTNFEQLVNLMKGNINNE